MDPLVADRYRFFIHWVDGFKKKRADLSSKIPIDVIFNFSVGYNLEDRDELLEFLKEYYL